MTAELSRIVAESAIRDLLCEYTHLIDQGRLREVAALFASSDYGAVRAGRGCHHRSFRPTPTQCSQPAAASFECTVIRRFHEPNIC